MKTANFKTSIKTLSGKAISGYSTVIQSNGVQFIIIADSIADLEKYGINNFSTLGVKRVVVFEDVRENICQSCMEEK